jgi:hypothetical protein
MYIINEANIKTLKHTFNSELSGLMFKDISYREIKALKRILDRNKITYDVVKDLNYYQVITDLEEDELDEFKDIVEEFEVETGHKTYDYFINRRK